MTVSATTTKAVGEGNGATTEWPFTYRVFQASDVEVILTSAAGVESILASNLYTVVLNSGGVGGKVVYPLAGSPIAAGLKLTSRRKTAQLQNSRLGNQGAFYPKVHEDALDRLTMAVQELQEQADRSVKVDISSGDDPQLLIDQLDADVTAAAVARVAAELAQSLAELAETNAETAQAAAAASAVAALASQVAAAASQASTSASAIAAAASEGNANTYKLEAQTAKTAAETAQAAALASQTEASASATAAAGSATTAGGHVTTTTANAAASSASATAAAASAAAAAASASAVNLPSAAGHALGYIRQKATEDGFEYRTPSQVLADIGAPTSSDLAVVSTKAQAGIDIGVSAYIKTDVAGNDASGVYGRVFSDDFETDTIGASSTNETYDVSGKYYHNAGGYTADLTGGQTYSASSDPYSFLSRLFDDNSSNEWQSDSADAQWVKVQFGTAKTITKMTIRAHTSDYDRVPTTWVLKASNTGAFAGEQVTIHTVTAGANYSASEQKTFTFANASAYTHYRLEMTGKQGGFGFGAEYVVNEIEMMGTVAPANMTLVSNAVPLASEPNDVSLYFDASDVNAVTNGTDRKIYASIDGGATWEEASAYTVVGAWSSTDKLIRADVNVSAQTGTSLKWKLEALNAKEQQIKQVTGYAA
jgi:hypothetical protein